MWLAIAWLARQRFLPALGVVVIGLPLVAMWLDPGRPRPPERELAAAKLQHARQEERLLAQARAEPPTGRLDLSFQKLSFFLPPEVHRSPAADAGFAPYLPAGIRQYDGRDVRLAGFMLPTRMERGMVQECIILASPMGCCFGQTPRFCEFVIARFGKAGVPEMMDQLLYFEGKFQVGDVFADGTWVALYAMNCTAVGTPDRLALK
ncbi:MAG TPA: hypothetical protein VG734_21625 [Lacunisphaera sp.]|nr:hypothetical protein [Lacunisphaera sp.]